MTLAMWAARRSWPKLLQMLLAASADPNARDADEHTPLLHAIDSDSFDGVKLLLAAGADMQCRDPLGRNVAEIARQQDCHRIARYLEPLVE